MGRIVSVDLSINKKSKVMTNELNTTAMMSGNTYSLEQIKTIAPSVFTTDKAPHLTDKYIQTPTMFLFKILIL